MANTIKGADMLLYVNTGTVDLPVYTKVGGQRSAELSRSVEQIDVTTKDTEGFRAFETTFQEWGVSCEALMVLDDTAFDLLETSFNNNARLKIQLKTANGIGYEGEVVITEFPISFDYEDISTVSIEMAGASPLVRMTPTP